MIDFKKVNDEKNDATIVAVDYYLILITYVNEIQSLKDENDSVLDFDAFIHVHNDISCFEELKENENFSNIVVGNTRGAN